MNRLRSQTQRRVDAPQTPTYTRRSMEMILLVVTVCLTTPSPLNAAGPGDRFGPHWHDGHAELSGYRLTVTRYGQPRVGRAVAIYVTEPFSRSGLVKADNPSRNPDDTFDVMKLNLVRDFQTGVYDYNTMVSVFTRSSDFVPVKITFTSAEWCGHVYEELRWLAPNITHQLSSYFEGETTTGRLKTKPGGVTEDGLMVLLRGLRGEYLASGQAKIVPFLPGSFYRRLNHQPIGWTSAKIEHLAQPQRVEIPAGVFNVTVYVVTVEDGRQGRFEIELPYPHRVVRWSWGATAAGGAEASETGELTGSTRLKYWQLKNNGHESYLAQLGFE